MDWISVKDRLPEIGDLVLASNNSSSIMEERWVVAAYIDKDRLYNSHPLDATTRTA